ncbi:MAG TPA: ribosome silencing factor [Thermoanaerobaculia bacterium]|nr:ribosome silencing factor [Thermoanaerobaculia bacterium]
MNEAAATKTDTVDRVRAVAAAALDRKALDLKILDLSGVSDFTDYFIVCSGGSDRQVRAIADHVEECLREQGVRPLHSEGRELGRWVLLDYGDLLLHVFDQETREFYQLERLWSDAADVTAELGA